MFRSADEILYQSAIHPLSLASSLSLEQITTLRQKMISICQVAVSVRADSSRFPKDWLFGVRWGKGKGKKEGRGERGVLLVSPLFFLSCSDAFFLPPVSLLI